jgi:hypothetical protein
MDNRQMEIGKKSSVGHRETGEHANPAKEVPSRLDGL